MARRWVDPSAFRVDSGAVSGLAPSRRQSTALLAVLLLVAGAVVAASYLIRPDRARAFDLLHGSLLIGDQYGPVNVDLASGRATYQISGADKQAGVDTPGGLALVPFGGGTLLLNSSTGEFNVVDVTGFVIKHDGGVTIPGHLDGASAAGMGAGENAFIERVSPAGTDVLAVNDSTVQLAAGDHTSVRPRAGYSVSAVGTTAPGGFTAANGGFWAMFKTTGGWRVDELTVPAQSSTGATLHASVRATVPRVATLETASRNADGTGTDVVGLAYPGTIRVFPAGGPARTVHFRAPHGTDSILPVSNAQGRLTYLLHANNGWSMVSVAANGGGAAGPVQLGTIDPAAQLAPPAASLGSIYTMQRDGQSGSIYRIDGTGKVTAVGTGYPRKKINNQVIENAPFTDAYLVADQTRVIVDSPTHYLALTIFTDSTRSPLVIEKTNLTSVNAAISSSALTQGTTSTGAPTTPKPNPSGSQTKQTGVTQVDPKINCKDQNVKPHVPQIDDAEPAARSVYLHWTYTRISSNDCVPSTYVVSVTALSADAPSAPGQATLQGLTSTTVAGLYPSTRYQFTVTAYINGQSTPSLPLIVTTGREGPGAARDIGVVPDSSGNLTLSWSSCGTVAQSCVPADGWSIQPSFCDGVGVSSGLPAISAPGDPTSVRQPSYVFKGGADLLGRGLSFRIVGTGDDGTQGTVSAPTPCTYTYGQPNASAMTLSASAPGDVALGGSTTATVTLNLGANPVLDVGGVGAKVTLGLSGNGTPQSKVITVDGSQSTVSANFGNVTAGVAYQGTATVTTAHGNLSAQLTPAPVSTRADWPATTDQGGSFGVHASCQDQVFTCALSANVTGLSSAQAGNEKFSLQQSDDPRSGSYVNCANAFFPLKLDGFDPATGVITANLSQLSGYYGTCRVQLVLLEDQTGGPLVFGGTASPALVTNIDLGSPPAGNAGNGDFSATWNGANVVVSYTGSDSTIGLTTTNWKASLTAPDNSTGCGSTTSPGNAPTNGQTLVFTADQGCINSFGGQQANWTVNITWNSVVLGTSHSASTTLAGPVPAYQQCAPTVGQFSANWVNGSQVSIVWNGDPSTVAGCPGASWVFTLYDQNSTLCGANNTANGASDPKNPVTLTVSCQTKPVHGWTVRFGYTDPAGKPQTPLTIPLSNDPP